MRSSYFHVKDRLEEEILSCRNGRRLSNIGLKEEVSYCSQTNITDLVPILVHDTLIAKF